MAVERRRGVAKQSPHSVWRRSPCLRLVEGGYCISALQRLAATELRAVGLEGGAMKQGHAARLAKHFHEAVEEVVAEKAEVLVVQRRDRS